MDVSAVLGFDPKFIDETGKGARVCTCPSGAVTSACPVHRDFLVRMDKVLDEKGRELSK
jgi:hypothetical protein